MKDLPSCRRRCAIHAAALLVAALCMPAGAGRVAAQGQKVHGAESIFASDSVAIVWAALKGTTEADTMVVIRIVNKTREYAYVSVEGLHPFTKARTTVVDGLALDEWVDVRSPRPSFVEFPSREIHLYRTAAAWRAKSPTLTVYYLSVPDTTPELASEASVLSYFSTALARTR